MSANTSSPMPPRRPSQSEIDVLMPGYLARIAEHWNDPSVAGIDIGYRYTGSQVRTEELAVRMHVDKQQWSNSVGSAVFDALPTMVDGLNVLAVSYRHHGVARDALPPGDADPIQPGTSVSHWRALAGTLGLIVFDRTTPDLYILSNHHVLFAPQNAREGDAVIQPGLAQGDMPSEEHVIARLSRSMNCIHGDAAIARLRTTREHRMAQLHSGVTIDRAEFPFIADVVRKSGIGTGSTCGFVDGVGRYRAGQDSAGFDGFRIVPLEESLPGFPANGRLSDNGDSGAVWHRYGESTGVGLHVGGESRLLGEEQELAIACYLPPALDILRVCLVPPA